jgi:hypothetical protein
MPDNNKVHDVRAGVLEEWGQSMKGRKEAWAIGCMDYKNAHQMTPKQPAQETQNLQCSWAAPPARALNINLKSSLFVFKPGK